MRRAAVIMAGGSGTRLWPLSRKNRPKQLLQILGGKSLLFRAFERLSTMFDPHDIYVICLAEHIPAVAEELPMLPAINLIGEPVGRDTAAAVALSAAILHHRDPDTTMGVFTADHLIRPVEKFAASINAGFDALKEFPDSLITFGIKPTEPHTGMGYVHRGPLISKGVFEAAAFKEKPDLAIARGYLASGEYYWNSGMFLWRTHTILSELERHVPETYAITTRLAREWSDALAQSLYPSMKKISIDFAVMEKTKGVLVVEMNLDWLDVGSWTALPGVTGVDAHENAKAATNAVVMDAAGNILVAEDDHLIAAIGVKDLVIIHSPDATLVCHKDHVQRIKDLVAALDAEHKGRYS